MSDEQRKVGPELQRVIDAATKSVVKFHGDDAPQIVVESAMPMALMYEALQAIGLGEIRDPAGLASDVQLLVDAIVTKIGSSAEGQQLMDHVGDFTPKEIH